jgi:hypothetical protein
MVDRSSVVVLGSVSVGDVMSFLFCDGDWWLSD